MATVTISTSNNTISVTPGGSTSVVQLTARGPKGDPGIPGPSGSIGPQGPSGVGITGSFATTGSNTFTGDQNIEGTLTASLQEGYVWVGDANGRTTTVSTSSFGGGGADLTSLNAFTASQELLNTTFATTGSNHFNGPQTITGSLVITDGIVANSFTGSILASNGLVSSSNQIEEYQLFAIQGPNEFDGDQIVNGFVSASAGVYANVISPLNGSDTINLTATNIAGDILTVNSLVVTGSVSGDAFQTFAITGSNTFIGNQTISGSIRLEGDTVDNGINFGTGNTYVGTAEGFLFIKDASGYIQIDAQNPTNYAQIVLAADNEAFFYVNHNTTNNNLKFTTSGSLLLNEIPYDAHLATTSSLLTLATTGSNSFIGDQNVLGRLNLLSETQTSSIALWGGDLEITAPDNTGISLYTYNTSTDTSYNWYFNSSGELTFPDSTTQTTAFTGFPDGLVSGSSQIQYSGLTGIPSGLISGSSQVTMENAVTASKVSVVAYGYSGDFPLVIMPDPGSSTSSPVGIGLGGLPKTNASTGIITANGFTGSLFGTSSYSTYAKSGPFVSGSSQITSSLDGRYVLITSFENYTSSQDIFNDNVTDLTSKTGSYASTGSNTFVGNQIIQGSLTGSFFTTNNQNLVLSTTNNVNSSTGTITINNGSNGEIRIAANGSGLISTTNGSRGGIHRLNTVVSGSGFVEKVIEWDSNGSTIPQFTLSNGVFTNTSSRTRTFIFSMQVAVQAISTGFSEVDIWFSQSGTFSGTNRKGQTAYYGPASAAQILSTTWNFILTPNDTIRCYVWSDQSFKIGDSAFGNNRGYSCHLQISEII